MLVLFLIHDKRKLVDCGLKVSIEKNIVFGILFLLQKDSLSLFFLYRYAKMEISQETP